MPVHSKDAKAITAPFGKVLTTANPRHLRRIQTDKGKKFFNSNFQALMKRNGIQHCASESEQKAAMIKRVTAPLRPGYGHICRIASPCTDGCHPAPDRRLQPLAPPPHRHGLRYCPEERQKPPMGAPLRRWRHPPTASNSTGSYCAGQQDQNKFWQGLHAQRTKTHFTVSQVSQRRGTKRREYKLVDYNEEDVKGSWYPEEINKC